MKRMKRIKALSVVMILSLIFSNLTIIKASCEERRDYILVLNNDTEGHKIAESYNLDYEDESNSLLNKKMILEGSLNLRDVKKLEKREDVAVGLDISLKGCVNSGTDISYATEQWYLDAINVNGNELADSEVVVAVLDSGVSYSESLNNVEWYNLIDDTNNVLFDDVTGHGTAIAGMIGSNGNNGLLGINPNAKLMSVKILDENLSTPVSRVVEAIYLCIEKNVDIINMSFGTMLDSDLLQKAIRDAKDAGIMMIAAAGNTYKGEVLFPAAYEEVVAVGATSSDGTIAEYTASGNEVELLAPGEGITVVGLFDGITAVDGTSIATAEVTGVASILMAKEGANPDNIRALLNESSKEIVDSDAGFIDCEYALANYDEFISQYSSSNSVELTNSDIVEDYGDSVTEVSGQWAASKHAWLVNKTATDNITNAKYIEIMALTAQLADSLYGGTTYYGLHGFGNYFINAKALWKYANYMAQGYSAKESRTKVEELIGAECFTQSVSDEKGDYWCYIRMLNAVTEMLTTCSNSKVQNYLKENNDAYEKYLVMGFLMHYLGDVYAHRTLVPGYVITNAKAQRNASGNSKDYKSYLGKSDFTDWEGLENAYNKTNRTLTFPGLKNYMKKSIDGFEQINQVYEDNVNFCRERLNASVQSCQYLASRVSEKGQTYSADVIQEYTNVSLIKFSTYYSCSLQ